MGHSRSFCTDALAKHAFVVLEVGLGNPDSIEGDEINEKIKFRFNTIG